MNDIKEVAQNAKSVWESFKKIFALLKERKLFAAFKESFRFLKLIYDNHLKGKYVTIRGKRVPRTLLAVIALFLLYTALPSCEQKSSGEESIAKADNVKKDANTYDKDGLKIYDLHKCEKDGIVGVCGIIENYGDNNFKYVKVELTFHSEEGRIVYEGSVEASDVVPHARSKMNVPCSVKFSYFKLKVVETEGITLAE